MKQTKNKYNFNLRKIKKVGKYIRNYNIRNCKLIECNNDNKKVFFKPIKERRKVKTKETNRVESKSGKGIATEFVNNYEALFYEINDNDDVMKVLHDIEGSIDNNAINDLILVTETTLGLVLAKIKPGKHDPFIYITFDNIKKGPETLITYIVPLLRSCISHNQISLLLFLARLMPRIEDKLGNSASIKSYRISALNSIFLKIFDCFIINNFGHHLQKYNFQFKFMKGSGTDLCIWTVIETIYSYLSKGSLKADSKLLETHIPTIFLSMLLKNYRSREA